MKTQNKRAQSAVEYLMTYGWAILVIIVVGAALWKLGVFDVSKYTGSAKLAIADFTVSGSQLKTTQFQIKIGAQQSITVNTFNVTVTNSTTSLADTACGGADTPTGAWSPNTEKNIICTTVPGGLAAGSSYNTKVQIAYTDSNNFAHVTSGTYSAKVE